jgi:phage terminase small subunit
MGIRGNRPKPVAEKIIRGNPGHRKLTTIVAAPRNGEMSYPLHLAANETAKAYWDMYLANAAPGHLAPIDAPLLTRLCMALSRVDEAERQMGPIMLVKAPNTGVPIQSPFLAIINRQTDLARKLASELALPPAQRNRLGIHEGRAAVDDPFEQYFTR